jgi:hypothetical protein
LADKRGARQAAIASEAKRKTFAEIADKFMAEQDHAIKAKTAKDWRRALKKYARPLISRDVSSITMAEVLEVLETVARSRPKMFGKFRQKLERIF